ncbi:MAG TPA: glycerol-3-phosphate 1-O-acyltransferase PlsY, partial [Firmicutes bacterium]|nr:glycerol-3-phosphate 1-O-acyltransferase PlsY [Candidatus Fermentithermobacillaceae bacterium]
ISKLAGIDDIMSYGSGNTGATNVFRVLGLKHATTVLIIDILKGFLPAYFGLKYLGIGNLGPLVVGVCAIIGHNWSAFLRFKGGKGVATTAGVAMVAFPKILAVSVIVFLITVAISKYVSLGSLLGVWAGFACSLLPQFTMFDKWAVFGLAAVVTYRHRSNIQRLLSGTELRLGQKGEKG